MSVARFIADQRTNYAVPHTTVCALLGVSEAWFYKWIKRADGPGAASGLFTDTDRRRDTVDRAVAVALRKAKGLHGSPRLREDLREAGWRVSEKTVAESMRRQGLVARVIKRRSGLTRQDRTAPKVPDLVRRDFTAPAPNYKWVGDITEIPTAEGKLYLATVIDLYSRRLLGAATSAHPDADLACAAIRMAVTARARSPPCRRRGVLLFPGVGSPVPARVRHPGPGPGRRHRLGLRVLQPPTPTQRRWHDVTGQLRADHRDARPGRRIAASPPRSGGNRRLMHTMSARCVRPPLRRQPRRLVRPQEQSIATASAG